MRPPSRVAALAVSLLVAAGTVGLAASPAAAASADVVISQVYGGGGNSGATYTNDFIELRNSGGTAVDVTGWSVQYASAAGTSWQVTTLSGTIAPGAYFLVQQSAGAGGSTPLPTPDATGSIALSGTSGKVALVTAAAALTCGADCDTAAGVRDFVGYGAANDFETAATPALSNTTAALRGTGADTDNNAADFTVGAPNPRNSGGGGPTDPPVDPGVPGLRIADIQGTAHLSPRAGVKVAEVPGVVTAVSRTGFWFEDPTPDADPATSDGLLVFTRTTPTVAVGDAVTVTGTVTEFRPGNTATNLTITQLTAPTVTVTASGQPLPAPAVVGTGGRVPPSAVIEDDASGDVETTATAFDPATDGLDFWESLEGTRISITDAQVVGPTNDFDETVVVPPGSTVRTSRGGIVTRAGDFNPERIVLDTVLAPIPAANVGDSFAGATVGVVDYSFGNYAMYPTASPTLVSGNLQRETTRKANLLQLSVGTFNVENLAPGDAQAKYDQLAAYVVTNLAAPDVLALEEIQDNSGSANDGTVAADQTLAKLVAAIRAAGGPAYQSRSIDPVDGADGGQPGGNIRVAFLYRTDRGLSFVDRPGGTATTPTTVTRDSRGKPHLSYSPGRIDPANPAWTSSRKPLAGEFRWRGQTMFVIANHFNSKGGDSPVYGRYQPIREPSAVQRAQQAAAVRGFVDELVAADPRAKVVVAGDINDFEFSNTADVLTSTGSLIDLPRTLPQAERYTYVFQGNSQVLDHILISPGLAYSPIPACDCVKLYEYDVVHVNAEFTDQVSDHDPQVVRLLVVP
ncbi:MAG: putative large secreted protein [uncultured Corynebacteriales bacterium]|uniref:Putative large secreted protein n=1 Tax=uncultured Mycobacteriales bacterium TaxID=581187 RepID=A0A6J4I5U3_9ACTN|nr:MAG: putative large secreted protein [uncultured Corynebacteriales bacterium]